MAPARHCVFCNGRPVTNEHILHRSWGPLFEHVSDRGNYTYTHVTPINPGEPDGPQAVEDRPVWAFDLKVRRACGRCNSTWMNQLDLELEGSLLDVALRNGLVIPGAMVATWRRWSIKVAIMRHFQDNPVTPASRTEIDALYAGEVPPGWRTFVGRCDTPTVMHANAGFAAPHEDVWPDVVPHELDGCEYAGITQTSWVLGRAVIVAVRSVTPAPVLAQLGYEFVEPFIDAGADHGSPLIELDGDGDIWLEQRPLIDLRHLPAMMWFTNGNRFGGWTPFGLTK